jgi:hypothetical protein
MFIDFFYKLKDVGIPVSPTSFLTLQKALGEFPARFLYRFPDRAGKKRALF